MATRGSLWTAGTGWDTCMASTSTASLPVPTGSSADALRKPRTAVTPNMMLRLTPTSASVHNRFGSIVGPPQTNENHADRIPTACYGESLSTLNQSNSTTTGLTHEVSSYNEMTSK